MLTTDNEYYINSMLNVFATQERISVTDKKLVKSALTKLKAKVQPNLDERAVLLILETQNRKTIIHTKKDTK